MKKSLLLTCTALYFIAQSKAQYLQNFTGDNYSGSNGIILQPASMVDSRYKYDINLFAYQTAFSSSYKAYNANFFSNISNVSSFEYYRKSLTKSYYYKNEDMHLPSVMISITPRDAVGFTKRTRTISNIDGLEQDLAEILFNYGSFNPVNTSAAITNKNLSYQYMKYKETSFSYARILRNENEHFIKAGAALKIVNGVEALALYTKQAQVTSVGGIPQFVNTEFSYGYSRNTSKGFNNRLGLGFDLGFVYEYRPEHKSYYYDMDNKTNLERKDQNKYKFRLGASLLDVGRIKFTKTDSSHNFTVNSTGVNIGGLLDNNSPQSVNSFIGSSATQPASSNKNTFGMNLPTALSIQADYHFIHNFYFGYVSYIPLWLPIDKAKVHNIMMNVVTARYETRNFGAAIPVSLTRNGRLEAGFNLRYGPFTIGATNLSTYLIGQRKIFDVNFYISMRSYQMFPAPADKDGDKVSDKKDFCPTEPGTWALEGCPDTDMDGLADYKDYCPNVAGPLSLNGCPDTDGDGVLDYMDACPTEKGFPIHKGCPDRDRDGIIDIADRCPDVPGIHKNNGCPEEPIVCCADSDGDGILDRFDNCPEVFGLLVNKGCPENITGTDSQTRINDAKQSKPENKTNTEEKVEKTTTPKKDTEKQTKSGTTSTNTIIHDTLVKPIVDRVPTDPIPVYKTVPIDPKSKGKTNKKGKGNSKEQQPSIDTTTVMDNPSTIVYFDKDSYTLLPKYKRDLDNIVKQMLANQTAKVLLQGHTDNDGDDEYNNTLSYKRTIAVQQYIMQKGKGRIDSKRVEILYFGEKKPVIENSDEKKKQINRRVELKLIP